MNWTSGRRWPLWLLFGAVLISFALTVTLGARVFSDLNQIQRAPDDNIQWSVSQLETEAVRMQLAAYSADDGPEALAEFRKRFDIFYSRLDLIVTASAFAPLHANAASHETIESIQMFLERTIPLVDGPDEALLDAMPGLREQISVVRDAARDVALATVEFFARTTDENRARFSELVFLTTFFAISLIVLLALSMLVLIRQMRLARLRETEARLSEQRLTAMVNSALDAVIAMNAKGEIVEFSPAAETIFGYRREQAIGEKLAELIVPEQHREAHATGLKRHLETGEAVVVGGGRFELSAIDAQGVEFPVELAVGRTEGEDGPIFIAYLRNITYRKDAEAELLAARNRAQEADLAKSEFLAVMSHEMRTPLNGVMGAIDLMRTTNLDDKQAEYVALAESAGEILLRHIRDVLDITKIEAGKFDIEAEPFSPASLVRDLAEVTQEEASKRGNRIGVEIDPAIPPWVLGDPHRVRQVLLNFASNAIKFTSGGEITLDVRLAGDAAEPARLEFAVRDTGIGVEEADIKKLFGDFVVLDPSYTRDVGGSGLGLAICRRIITAMSGEIGVESVAGEGSRFWFRLTLPETEAPAPSVPVPELSMATSSERVLLAEDNLTSRTIAEEMLVNAGYDVTTAVDGVEAVAKANGREFDIILLDISMPRMDGVKAAELIRSGAGGSKHAMIFALTAHAMPEEIQRFLAAGMHGCLTKPLRRDELLSLLSRSSGDCAEVGAASYDTPAVPPQGAQYLDAGEIERLVSEVSPAFAVKILRQFSDEIDRRGSTIRRAAENGDYGALLRSAHGLHGAAATIGASSLAETMMAVEQACKEGRNPDADRAMINFDAIVEGTKREVEAAVADLSQERAS